ncbi:TPA: hypothetical protein ACJJJL_002229, partial [Neisseria meningitidis]
FGCFRTKYPLFHRTPHNRASAPPFRRQRAHLACWPLSTGSNTPPSDGLRTHFVISNVPSTPNLLRGRQLEGKLILEVPAQVNPIPQSVLRAAQEENVIIRDTTGRIYK